MQNDRLIDNFGREITYMRLSVTDRCDFRCIYCMSEDMTFLPKKQVLSLEELATVAKSFVELGVKKIRVTGGEPLIRKDVISLFQALGQIPQLEELCLTTNGSHLKTYAKQLKEAGVSRINISLDTLNTNKFAELTRHGKLDNVLEGIDACIAAGFQHTKINAVLLNNYNLNEATDLVQYAIDRELDISFIEEMPLGEILTHARDVEFVSSAEIRQQLEKVFTLVASTDSTGGPARYWTIPGNKTKVGFISPHSENFCASCNRVRVSASGKLLLCLGNEHSVDLKQALRQSPSDVQYLKEVIMNAMTIKPEKHDFNLDEPPQILRFMNATGG